MLGCFSRQKQPSMARLYIFCPQAICTTRAFWHSG